MSKEDSEAHLHRRHEWLHLFGPHLQPLRKTRGVVVEADGEGSAGTHDLHPLDRLPRQVVATATSDYHETVVDGDAEEGDRVAVATDATTTACLVERPFALLHPQPPRSQGVDEAGRERHEEGQAGEAESDLDDGDGHGD